MVSYGDRARFTAEDPDDLVLAALACPYCLGVKGVEWTFARSGSRPVVRCSCAECQTDWYVFLTAPQALRLGLMDTLDRLAF